MRNIAKSLRFSFFIIGLGFVILCFLFFIFALKNPSRFNLTFLPYLNDNNDANKQSAELLASKTSDKQYGNIEVTDKFYEEIKQADYGEIKNKTGDLINSPNLQQTDIKTKFDKRVLNNKTPEVHDIIFNGTKLDPTTIDIKQGDLVQIINKSNTSITIKVQDLGPMYTILTQGALSQSFDIKGQYKIIIATKSGEQLLSVKVL